MKPLTVAEVLALPVTVDLVTAASAFGLGRDNAYRLAKTGELPFPVLKLGRRLVVTRNALLTVLGIEDQPHNSLTDATPTPVGEPAPDTRSDATLRVVG
jgi:hypothetical protein